MRGEKVSAFNSAFAVQGSPPHARGKAKDGETIKLYDLITPACAGKSRHLPPALTLHRDHPRMRGEKERTTPVHGGDLGSPPHARGKEHGFTPHTSGKGITPACAGKSPLRQSSRGTSRDHPRMRGEKRATDRLWYCCQGSPPHARGKVPSGLAHSVLDGITPACAGKSCMAARDRAKAWDHPRMRGEKILAVHPSPGGMGSPPHARGKGPYSHQRHGKGGITPACAGKS